MSRPTPLPSRSRPRFPRVSGDEPRRAVKKLRARWFSPRERG